MNDRERVALVTGAASGIGAATAIALAASEGRIECIDRDEAGLARTVAAIEAVGGEAVPTVLDLGVPAELDRYLAGAAQLGPLRSVAFCAALHRPTPITDLAMEDYRAVLDVDLDAQVRLMSGLLPRMRTADGARVVFVSSVQAQRAEVGSLAYGIAKAGIEAMVRTLAAELGSERILVNAVAPGFVDTPMSRLADGTAEHETAAFRQIYVEAGRLPLGRPAAPEEIAAAIFFLLSEKNTYITGHSLVIDGGLTAVL